MENPRPRFARLAVFLAGVIPLTAVGCGSSSLGQPDAASVTRCLRSHQAFIQSDQPPPGVPPARAILEFGFASRPAPVNQDSGSIILTKSEKDRTRWIAFIRADRFSATSGPLGAVISWNHGPGHPQTKRILYACIRGG